MKVWSEIREIREIHLQDPSYIHQCILSYFDLVSDWLIAVRQFHLNALLMYCRMVLSHGSYAIMNFDCVTSQTWTFLLFYLAQSVLNEGFFL